MELKLKHLSAILAVVMTTSVSANTETKIASEPIQALKQSLYDNGAYNLSGKEGFSIKTHIQQYFLETRYLH